MEEKEAQSEQPNIARYLILLTVLIPMTFAGLVIWGAVYAIDWFAAWRWSTWLILAPVVYFSWLVLFLGLCARNSHRMGSKHPKPRYVKFQRGAGRAGVPPGMRTVTICMFRFGFIRSLPLVHTLEQVSFLRNLVLRSYSPSVHIAQNAFMWGSILDPDLTEIGEGAVIGWSSQLACHVFNSRSDGSYVYVSSPIKIKAGATIGGNTLVALGSVIGEGAVVEPMSFVAPFTVIPPGEIWGGVPARCLVKPGERRETPVR